MILLLNEIVLTSGACVTCDIKYESEALNK